MQPFVIWFIAAFVLVVVELMSGSLFLLVIGAGAAAGGLMALAGTGFAAQLGAAAVVSVAGIAVLKAVRRGGARTKADGSLAFDTGQSVDVLERQENGELRVNYRGTQWDAEVEGGGAAAVGERRVIKETRGNKLILKAEA